MSLITINQVNCKDCYKCVRYCPVKAIRVVGGHAEVVEARCLGDGGCVHVCPQHAKQVRSDLEVVRGLLASGRLIVASVAPSAAGIFGDTLPHLLGALKALGFARVEETARTAEAIARAHTACAEDGRPHIATACPAIVSLVERYYPTLTSLLVPVPSPMVAHARLLRDEYGPDTGVVFIGPCVAKKGEADSFQLDAALTFDELLSWLSEADMALESVAPRTFDNPPVGIAELFPLPNGMLRTAGQLDAGLSPAILTVSGINEVRALLDDLPNLNGIRLIEALACEGGCMQGPGSAIGPSSWVRRKQLLHAVQDAGTGAAPENMARVFTAQPLCLPLPTDEEITTILRRTGKHNPSDEQNCGACGYDTCREKAIAVYQGMAEAEMCIPYMRLRAESFANVVIRNTPNGIIVVDRALRVLDANPAFCKLFDCTVHELIGRPLKTVLDPQAFERVNRTGQPFVRQDVRYGAVITRELIFPVADEDVVIGIYVDITDEMMRQQKQLTVKQETLGKARQVIEKQMRVAQEIAGLLGETTAETKVLLTRLINLYDEEDGKD